MRKIIIILITCTVVLLMGYAGYRGYKTWKQKHMMTLAREFLAKSDMRNAMLCLQQVLRANPRHLEGARLMAQFMEAERSPGAVLWRERVLEINPHSLNDRLALAQTALLFHDYTTATHALEGADSEGKKTAAYHNIAGATATAENQIAQAEEHFSEAARLQPQDLTPQLNLAVLRLHSTNELDLAEARITMQRIQLNTTNGQLRCEAERELAVDAMRFKEADKALALTKQLMAETNSVFNDRLMELQILRSAHNNEFKSALIAFQREAGTNSAKTYELSVWQMANLGPADTLTWLRSLPPATQTNQPVALLKAECYAILQDWKGLQSSLANQNWADLEFTRRALNTRALRGLGLTEAAKAEWEVALNTASGHKSSQVMLLRLAAQWGWHTETEDLLWTIVNRYPGETWATTALGQALFASGRTRSLMTLYSQELKRNPGDQMAKNNLAMIALLLDANELKPHELAHEVYQGAPTNSSYVSTYAYSLLVQKKGTEALKVIEKLKPEELKNPSIAGYYGLILKNTGSSEKARTYLDIASKAHLLPEEQKLFSRAKAT